MDALCQLSYEGTMERVMGIEPTQSTWEADILPLNYTRILELCCAIQMPDYSVITGTNSAVNIKRSKV